MSQEASTQATQTVETFSATAASRVRDPETITSIRVRGDANPGQNAGLHLEVRPGVVPNTVLQEDLGGAEGPARRATAHIEGGTVTPGSMTEAFGGAEGYAQHVKQVGSNAVGMEVTIADKL